MCSCSAIGLGLWLPIDPAHSGCGPERPWPQGLRAHTSWQPGQEMCEHEWNQEAGITRKDGQKDGRTEGRELPLAALTSPPPYPQSLRVPALEYLCSSCHHCGSWVGQGLTRTIIDTRPLGRKGNPASLVTSLTTDTQLGRVKVFYGHSFMEIDPAGSMTR